MTMAGSELEHWVVNNILSLKTLLDKDSGHDLPASSIGKAMKFKLTIILLCFLMGSAQATIRVSWAHFIHPDRAGYVVFRATGSPSNGYIQISSSTELVTDNFFLDAGAVGYKSFWYYVIAVDLPGNVLNTSIPECVIHYCHGDANLSGFVDIADAVLIERYVVGLNELTDEEKRGADANLDGFVDIADSVLVKRFVVELDTQESHCLVAQ